MKIFTSSQIKKYRDRYFHWNKAWDVNVFIRYYPAIQYISRRFTHSSISVLDVGSGRNGIAQFWKKDKVIGVDLFTKKEKMANRLLPVTALAYNLPFSNHAFEHVVCIDVLEHIPESDREKTIGELLRVMRSALVLAFPCGTAAEEKDKRSYVKSLERGSVGCYLEEHIREGLPVEKRIENVLAADKTIRIVRKIHRDNIALIQVRDLVNATVFSKIRRIILYPMMLAALIGCGKCYRTYWFVERL